MDPDDKDEWVEAAIFESKEAYVSNANRPGQHELFLKIMEYLKTQPTRIDGAYVISEFA